MVAGCRVIVPALGWADVRIRTHLKRTDRGSRRHIRRSLRDADRLTSRPDSAAKASRRIRTDLRWSHVSVHLCHHMIRLTAHITDLQHEVLRESSLYSQRPLLESRSFHHRIQTSWSEDRA